MAVLPSSTLFPLQMPPVNTGSDEAGRNRWETIASCNLQHGKEQGYLHRNALDFGSRVSGTGVYWSAVSEADSENRKPDTIAGKLLQVGVCNTVTKRKLSPEYFVLWIVC